MKKQIKENIQLLIDDNKLDEAMSLIDEYFKIDSEDIEIYSMKAVVFIMQGNIDKAEEVLKRGLAIDDENFDLNYNLGYLYEQGEKFNEAVKHYEQALENCNDEEVKSNITNFIEKISSEHEIISVEDKKKIVFFVKQGMDSFLGDIINGLSEEYETKKIVVADYKQIDEGMQWADICWFEWCDELVAYGSKHRLAGEKKIICRIHGYEVYGDLIKNTNWKNIDDLIIVAPHIRRIFEENTKDINKGKLEVHTIFCGINVSKFPLNVKNKGFNLGYLGYINFKKNIPLTLDIFKKLHDKDSRYKLYLAGEFQDARTLSYFNYFISEYKLNNCVFFDGWKNEEKKIEWFKKIDYIVISSIDEGLCFAAAEAMCSGIKPILHNCEGIKDHYDKKYIFNTIDEAVEMIMHYEYNSLEYRKFITDNYSLEKENSKIKNVILHLDDINEFNYSSYWNNRLDNKFDIEGVGYIGLGKQYNEYLYKSRFDVLNGIIKKIFKKSKLKSVFEIGPGIGMFSDYFQKNGVDKYFAIDISQKSVEFLSQKYSNFKFIQGDISENENYPKDEKYDLVFGADVLLHLTNENKFKSALKNMSKMLNSNGYMLIFDAISKKCVKNTSSHVKIREIKYLRRLADENGMEVIANIPIFFFMSNPFDIDMINLEDEGAKVINIFNLIQNLFNESSINIKDEYKKVLLEYLYYLDKLYLNNYKYGLSEKLIIMKQKNNKANINLSINDIWKKNDIEKNINNIVKKIENIKEFYNNNYLISLQQNLNSLSYSNYNIKEVYEKLNFFNAYETKYVDKYDFNNSKIIIGKKEILNEQNELIEFILSNQKEQLIIIGIVYDKKNKKIILPTYLNNSNNIHKINELVKSIIFSGIEYDSRGIAGFINDEKIADNIKNNQLAYSWERGIPATQFMPLMGYINVIERYKLTELVIKKSDIILEAACGFGYGAAFMSKRCKAVEALDLAEENIEFGKKTYKFNNINWIVGDVTKLPYSNMFFDVYVSFETLEHLPLNLVEGFLSESIRVLKNNGKMVISTPNRAVRNNIHNPFHIKEYNFLEFDKMLNKYFSSIEYYSIVNNRLVKGMNLAAYNMMAICCK